VACYDLICGVDQNGHIEAEAFDARSDLADLLFGVRPRVARIGFQLIDRLPRDFEARRRDRRNAGVRQDTASRARSRVALTQDREWAF
jgi:hypothetical protein